MMKQFYLYKTYVDIIQLDGSTLKIFFNENSGKVFFRYKIGSLLKVKHTGIFIGVDILGNGYFMHNHYINGRPTIVTQIEFAKGQQLFISSSPSINYYQIIENGMNEIIRGESYNSVDYNCQTFVNTVCNHVRKSEDVERIAEGVFFSLVAAITVVAVIKS